MLDCHPILKLLTSTDELIKPPEPPVSRIVAAWNAIFTFTPTSLQLFFQRFDSFKHLVRSIVLFVQQIEISFIYAPVMWRGLNPAPFTQLNETVEKEG